LFSDPHRTQPTVSYNQSLQLNCCARPAIVKFAAVACAVVAPSMVFPNFSFYWLTVMVTRHGNCNNDAGNLHCAQLRLRSESASVSRGTRVSDVFTVAFFFGCTRWRYTGRHVHLPDCSCVLSRCAL
jgi:hypothetical protein